MNFSLPAAYSILARTPALLNGWLRDLPAEWTTPNEGEDTWSAYDVIGHLIHGEKTDWIPRSRIMLSDATDKRLELFDRLAQFQNSQGKTLPQLLDEFTRLRKENLDTLMSWDLQESDLDKTGIHPEFDTVTLRQHLATWVTHDLTHISQIARVMAKQYKAETGPWVQYIGILR